MKLYVVELDTSSQENRITFLVIQDMFKVTMCNCCVLQQSMSREEKQKTLSSICLVLD